MKIFVAGASGVIGRRLVALLRDAGHTVTGTTRRTEGQAALAALGIDAVLIDVFDRDALERIVTAIEPDVVIHQLTDLAGGIDPAAPEAALQRNARLRRDGTANLVQAARAAGVRRVIAQSIAWVYAAKVPPILETDPLDVEAPPPRGITIRDGIVPLESAVLDQADFAGLVLRYGQFYGPETWSATATGATPVHVDAAAHAAFLAVDRGRPGAYNIAEPGGPLSIDKAQAELGWRADFRLDRHA